MEDHSIQILHIDLSKQTFKLKVHSELKEYFGGVGISTALLYRYFEDFGYPKKRQTAPFVLAIGPFCGLFPGCSQAVASFVSPQTNNLGQSKAGGDLGLRLKAQGIDGLFVKGKASDPTLLKIDQGEVDFEKTSLWKQGTRNSFAKLRKENPLASIAVIGPAGENGVRFASVAVDNLSSFSRMGLGTVWGQKKLKGIMVSGTNKINTPENKEYLKVSEKLSSLLGDPRPEGVRFGIREQNKKIWLLQAKMNGLPSKNFSEVKEGYLNLQRALFSNTDERESCGLCPVSCKDIIEHSDNPLSADYTTFTSLGPMLGITSAQAVLSLCEKAFNLGIDPVSLGSCLAFLVEKENWEFGHNDALEALLQGLVDRKEPWSKNLSFGVSKAASGKEANYAMAISNLELLPYFNGYFTILSQTVSPETDIQYTGAHLLDLGNIIPDEKGVQKFISEEKKGILCLSLASCPWLRGLYTLPQIFECSESLNLGWSHENLEALSSKIYNLKWKLKTNLGFDWEGIAYPRRLFGTPTATGYLEEEDFLELIRLYQQQLNL
ncbi:MAG: aldehyde ferredoxin oxidoreductase N-terminal domain-containing protein [Patescibacteria group bacterium]|nr:aldehyde ferredoxin oxidoreductase N-terminal domain-containing protein [Patescibacteria group bacterium]